MTIAQTVNSCEITFIHLPHTSENDVAYVPNYVSNDEETYLLNAIADQPASRWNQMETSTRRIQVWGGNVDAKLKAVIGGVQPLPPFLAKTAEQVGATCCSQVATEFWGKKMQKPNHVLVNEYTTGQGVMPHEDGPCYQPGVAILSLQSPAVITFTSKLGDDCTQNPPLHVALMPRSLLIFRGKAYTDYLHGIDDVEAHVVASDALLNGTDEEVKGALAKREDGHLELKRTNTRYSLTFRAVRGAMAWASLRK